MVYASIDKIKEWLQGITSAADVELANIQNDISLEIDRRLSLVTDLPIRDHLLIDEIAVFEARLSSLWFRYRRAGMQEREMIMKEIDATWEEFDRFLVNRFGYGVVIG